MKLKLIFILLLSCFYITSAFTQETAKQTYKSPNFEQQISSHKIVAILPLKVSISYRRMPKGFDAEGNKADEIKQGTSMQQGMYTYLLRKGDNYSVSFQDIDRTNALLKRAQVYE